MANRRSGGTTRVKRLDAMNHPPQRPKEEQPNPYQWGARRKRGAELQEGCRIQKNHQERRINQFRRGNRRDEQWLENQDHNLDWSSLSEEVESDATMNNRGRRFAPYRERRAEAYEYKMKIDLAIYDSKRNIETFLYWIKNNFFFNYMGTTEHKKVHLVALKLKGGASTWWDQVAVNRQKQGRQLIRSWEKMKKLMKQRFLPPNYEQTLYTQYQNGPLRSSTVRSSDELDGK
ncbi:reverse transcriptase [Cucumis melo var. makuwa]|uniref:Reverse transcriptase n=1 Tax=Cucumis melo var. makuwa TaxID=1194695 RepID=A0A5A7TFW7_CUCMM|nr:reverse transcriptase [Cucumis melo var. makuwa]TYK23391.1 reverse transcriptase [Cucumis melo var. makuwa]